MDDAAENWYDSDVATFGDRLAAGREATGMSQSQFAKRLGVKVATLRKWEDDFAEPRANRLAMISGILGVSMRWLITGEGEGVSGPDAVPLDSDRQALLTELREIRTVLLAKAEHVANIEKRLVKLLKDDPLA